MKQIRYILAILLAGSVLFLFSCTGNQENKLIGTWELTPMSALPGEYPVVRWEFTADNDVIKYRETETVDTLLYVGRWGFTKHNRLSIYQFEKDYNGEWEIVTLKNDVLRMVLKAYVNDNPAGQVLCEFTRVR